MTARKRSLFCGGTFHSLRWIGRVFPITMARRLADRHADRDARGGEIVIERAVDRTPAAAGGRPREDAQESKTKDS